MLVSPKELEKEAEATLEEFLKVTDLFREVAESGSKMEPFYFFGIFCNIEVELAKAQKEVEEREVKDLKQAQMDLAREARKTLYAKKKKSAGDPEELGGNGMFDLFAQQVGGAGDQMVEKMMANYKEGEANGKQSGELIRTMEKKKKSEAVKKKKVWFKSV